MTASGCRWSKLSVSSPQRIQGRSDAPTFVASMARGRGGHRFGSLGPLQMKGLAALIAVSEVLWDPIREVSGRVEHLPPALAGAGFPFAGRADVFERPQESWWACCRGGFGLVLLAGEPGVGKHSPTSILRTLVGATPSWRRSSPPSVESSDLRPGRHAAPVLDRSDKNTCSAVGSGLDGRQYHVSNQPRPFPPEAEGR